MKTKKTETKLSLAKLQITKLNNLEVIRGGDGNSQGDDTGHVDTFTTG